MLVSNTSDVHSVIFGEDVQFDNQASRRFRGDFGRSVIFVLVVIISVVVVFCCVHWVCCSCCGCCRCFRFLPKKGQKTDMYHKNQPNLGKYTIQSRYIDSVVVSNICLCSSLFGEDSHFDQYFSDGLKPPTR